VTTLRVGLAQPHKGERFDLSEQHLTDTEVISIGTVDATGVRNAIAAVALPKHAMRLRIVVVDDYLNGQLEALNRAAIDERWSWFLIKPAGSVAWIGPLIEAGGPCWQCLSDRLRMNGYPLGGAAGEPSVQSDHRELARGTCGMPVYLAASELVQLLNSERDSLSRHRLLCFDAAKLQAQYHPVVRIDRCSACGSTAEQQVQLTLRSCQKTADRNGDRTCSAEESLQRLSRQVSPCTGIIGSLTPAPKPLSPEEASPIYAYICKFRGHPWRRGSSGASRLEISFGKGTTDVQSRISGMAEALERYCGAYDPDDPRVIAKHADLAGAIHPHDLLMFSEAQYTKREITNRKDDLFNWVPHRFDDRQSIEWTAAWSLKDKALRYLPSAFCYYYYPDQGKRRFCIANSNGCASGNTIEEAILHGLFELIERDCVGIWWYNRLRLPEVALESFAEPYFDRMIAYLGKHRRCLRVIDLTNDLLVPAFAAVSWREDGKSILFGTAAHLNAKMAITRAITELNQRLPFAMRIDGGLPVSSGAAEDRVANWLRQQSIGAQSYLEPLAGSVRRKEDYLEWLSDDILVDVTHVIDRLSFLGSDTIVLNMSKAEIELPTVRVVVPGLRHSWARLAPGRLYDVPLSMRWLAVLQAEADLNPIAYFV
jgi:ribosomal protein S12 methylthiotransferase accessory factor